MMARTRLGRSVCWLCVFCFLALVSSSGCLFRYLLLLRGDCFAELLIKGQLLDVVTLEPATDVLIGFRAERGGEVIRLSSPRTAAGEPRNPLPDVDGGFSFFLDSLGVACPPTVSVPVPDKVTLLVVRGTCTEEISLDISGASADHAIEDTGGLRTDIFTLLDPVLVSPCAE